MESQPLGQEHTTDQFEDHGMATVSTSRFSKESWDEEPVLPTRSSNREQATEDDDTREDKPLMQAAGSEVPT